MRTVLALGLAAVVTAGCGGSHRSACPVTRGRTSTDPVFGRIIAFGRPPVEMVFGNPAFAGGRVMLGKAANGWFAIKTHFLTLPSFSGEFTARVRQVHSSSPVGSSPVGLGAKPPGGAFRSATYPRGNAVDATWMRRAGCYEWTISGHGYTERIVLHAIPYHP